VLKLLRRLRAREETAPLSVPAFTPAERRAIAEFDRSLMPVGYAERLYGAPPERRPSVFDRPPRPGTGL
jgi:hypothetical protein